MITIEYPLHRLYGGEYRVIRRVCYGGVVHYEIDVAGENVTVPGWMTERSVCAGLRCGLDPICSLTSLFELVALLDSRAV